MNDRTKLADELRKAGQELDNDANASMRDALIKIDLIVNSSNHGYEFSPLFDKLADIVDPTCRIYWTDTSYNTPGTGYVADGYYSCSHCHCEFGDHTSEVWDSYQASYYEGEAPFEYCPHCGARIINEEQQSRNELSKPKSVLEDVVTCHCKDCGCTFQFDPLIYVGYCPECGSEELDYDE